MLSVIIPAYNEDLSIDRAHHTITKILNKENIENEIIFVDENRLILGKYESGCIFCREVENLTIYCKKPVCTDMKVSIVSAM